MTVITPQAPEKAEAVSFEPMAALREWHAASSDPRVPGSGRYIDESDAYGRERNVKLRMSLITEEFREVMDELLDILNGKGDRVKLAKELADLAYVTYEAANNFEIPLQEVFTEVHKSNMTKVGADGKVQRRNDGKILKGGSYVPPDIEKIVLGGVSD